MNPRDTNISEKKREAIAEQEQWQTITTAADERRELDGLLAGLSLPRQVLTLAVWPFFENILAFLVSFVDTAIAGHLSVEATNAIGVGAHVSWLIGLVQASVGIGATAVVARAIGARRRGLANAALGQSLVLALLAGTAIGVVVYVYAEPIGLFTNLSGSSLALCTIYLQRIGAAAPCSALLFVGAAALRGAGDTRTPFIVFIVVNVVNAVLALLFVYAPAPLGGRGVGGIATATFIAWSVGALLITVALTAGWGGLRLDPDRLRPRLSTLSLILKVAAPNFLETFLGLWIANFLVLRIVGQLHDQTAWAAHIVTIRAEALSFMPGYAFGVAAATLAGQYLGLGDPTRARRAILLCWGFGALLMLGMGLLFIAVPEVFVRLITDEPEILRASPALLRIAGFSQLFFGTAIILGQGMRGAGDTVATMFLTTFSTYAIRLPLAYLFGIRLGWGLPGIWYALCLELGFRGVIFAIRFLRGRWATVPLS